MKKRGFGKGKYNGFGGKPNRGETLEQTAVRELYEESGVRTSIKNIEKIAKLDFVFPNKKDWNQTVHVFVAHDWEGEPIETNEMKPVWFHFDKLPFERMWQDDKHWLPLVLKGKKLEGTFIFKEDNKTIKKFNIKEI